MMFTLPYPPSSNRYWRHARGRTYVSEEAKAYKARVRWLALKHKVRPAEGPVSVSVSAYRPRKIGDLDNTLKVLLDSLQGVAFVDDSQIVEIHAMRLEDPADPRVVVVVQEGL